MVDDSAVARMSGQWKNPIALLRGFRLFLDQVEVAGLEAPKLIFLSRKNSPDEILVREEAKRLRIIQNIEWLTRPGGELFPSSTMWDLYSASDVVVDDFGVGWFGGVVVEAAAAGKPVVTYVDQEVMEEMYGSHPIISVREPEEIATALLNLYRNADFRLACGVDSLQWYEQYHSPKSAEVTMRKLLVELHLTSPN